MRMTLSTSKYRSCIFFALSLVPSPPPGILEIGKVSKSVSKNSRKLLEAFRKRTKELHIRIGKSGPVPPKEAFLFHEGIRDNPSIYEQSQQRQHHTRAALGHFAREKGFLEDSLTRKPVVVLFQKRKKLAFTNRKPKV